MPSLEIPSKDIGCPIPANSPHAVSVTLPSWSVCVAYMEGQDWVVGKINYGYPRFYLHPLIQQLAKRVEAEFGKDGELCLLFPSYEIACRCRQYVWCQQPLQEPFASMLPAKHVRVLQLPAVSDGQSKVTAEIVAVLLPAELFPLAKQYWTHSGEGISSRLAVFYMEHWTEKRHAESSDFVGERSDRNLDLNLASEAKIALKRRICGSVATAQESDVFLYGTGMAAVFSAHRALLHAATLEGAPTTPNKSVLFGFSYVDTLKVLIKFGPGVEFFGLGNDAELDQLEAQLRSGELKPLAVFTEFPSNPLLRCADIKRLRLLADEFGFAIVVDDTIGNFLNLDLLPYVDVLVSSLTKLFSGAANVMGGSLVLNPKSKWYKVLKETLAEQFEDTAWADDLICLERNSRDFAERNGIVNKNAQVIAETFAASPIVKSVFYPAFTESKKYYDEFKRDGAGYGALLSVVFESPIQARTFHDSVIAAKGPSLGTNFTIVSPYALLAHYRELDWVEKFEVDRSLVRISVGMEQIESLLKNFNNALCYAEKVAAQCD